MKPEGPFCQSCGMPMSRDEKGGGTEADGRKSIEYCSRCYANGAFTAPNMSAQQMVTLVEGKLKEMGLPPAMVTSLAGQIPSLGRWKR